MSLGILIEAYKKQYISEDPLRFYFQQISDRKDIWINPDLCKRLLEKLWMKYLAGSDQANGLICSGAGVKRAVGI